MSSAPYNLFSEHLKQRFGQRVHKISVDAGFSCPNRGGFRNNPGCIFCGGEGSGAAGIARGASIRAQLEDGREVMIRKYKAKRFLAYFQSYTNTFSPPETLAARFDEALAVPDVIGLAVATRPDCLGETTLDLLEHCHRRTYFWLELGLQSIHDRTLRLIRRGHDYATFLRAFHEAKARGLRVCVHVILGLPGEGREEMLATAAEMARLQVDGIKIHLLHVLEGTELARMYLAGAVRILEREEYIRLAVDFVERLHPTTLIQRLTGDGPRELLLAPRWSLDKWEILNAINDTFRRRGSYQGQLCGF